MHSVQPALNEVGIAQPSDAPLASGAVEMPESDHRSAPVDANLPELAPTPPAAIPSPRETPPTSTRGIASWYGRQFHGRKTASGERFNMYGLTAAHKTLPLMSYVRVSNPANGKSIVVRITDRGPFVANRMIDLSYGAAQELDIKGLGAVEMDTVDRADYEAQSDQATIERDLREASYVVPAPIRRIAKKPQQAKPVRR